MRARGRFEDSLKSFLKGQVRREDALVLASATGVELAMLFISSLSIKMEELGRTITYSRNVFIPLTNLCSNKCSYCGFRREPGEPGAGYMELDRALEVVRIGEGMGAKEVLVSTGDRPEAKYDEAREWLRRSGYSSTLEYVLDFEEKALSSTRNVMPHTNIGLLSKKEMDQLKPLNASIGLMLENVSERLMDHGMPHEHSPAKNPKARLRMIEDAGSLRIPFTTGILVGIGETWEERIDSLIAIRKLHERYGHVQEVIVQGFMPEPGTPMSRARPPSLLEVLKTIAIARLMFHGSTVVQAPPNLAGTSRQAYLMAGIDDWGGISPLTPDYVNPSYPWPRIRDLSMETLEAGFELRERLPAHPRYVLGGWLPPLIEERAEGVVDESGLVRRELEGEPLHGSKSRA